MSAGSGVEVNDALRRSFMDALANDSVGFIKVVIEADTFKQVGSGTNTGTKMGNLAEIAKVLEPRKPAYAISKTEEKDRLQMVFYIPDDSSVRDRMVYASSLAALKIGLGAAKFAGDYTIRDRKECTAAAYEESKKKGNEEDLLTMEERMGMRAETYVSMSTDTVKMSGMSDLPMKTSDEAVAAITALKDGTVSAIVLALDQATEVMGRVAQGDLDIAAIIKQLPAREPRYVAFRFSHTHPETKEAAAPIVFLYYCPDVAGPRMKMFYSSCKSMAVKTCDKFGLTIAKHVEISVPTELSADQLIDEFYPKKTVSKAFAKPAKPGRKGTTPIRAAAT